jgi:Tfp pilus assembly protein FimT
MIELIVVMILVAILAAIAIPRMAGLGDYKALAFRDGVANGLRYAQKTATSHRRIVCANFTNTTMKLTISATAQCDTALPLPNGVAVLASPDATNVNFGGAAPATMYFQPEGRITSDSLNTTPLSVTLSMGGQTVAIEGTTGYVE